MSPHIWAAIIISSVALGLSIAELAIIIIILSKGCM